MSNPIAQLIQDRNLQGDEQEVGNVAGIPKMLKALGIKQVSSLAPTDPDFKVTPETVPDLQNMPVHPASLIKPGA